MQLFILSTTCVTQQVKILWTCLTKQRDNRKMLMHFSLDSEESSSDEDQCYRRRTWNKYRQEVLQEFGYDEIQDLDSD